MGAPGKDDQGRNDENEKSAKTLKDEKNIALNLFYDNHGYKETETDVQSRDNDEKFHENGNCKVIDRTVEGKPNIGDDLKVLGLCLKRKVQRAFRKKTLYQKLPVLNWLPKYNAESTIGDLVAGITVGLTLIPQGLAYSNIMKIPVEYGLYGSFIGAFIYIIFGSCKDVSIGPSAILSLTVYQTVGKYGLQHIILMSFFTGLVQVLMGLFGLGFIIDFVSGPVSSGFTSAAALIIVTSQMKDILSIQASGSTFIKTWQDILSKIHLSSYIDIGIGVGCIIGLLLLRIIGLQKFEPKEPNTELNAVQKCINKFLWILGISRNAICVVACGFMGYAFSMNGEPPFQVIGHVPQGLPQFKAPPFGYVEVVNGTEIEHTVMDMVGNIGSGVFIVALIGLLENIAVCKAFSNGNPIDATQEFIAVGLCNIGNSFVQSFPINGPLARGAVNNASGVKTTLAGLYAGCLVIISLLCLTPYFRYIPRAALAGIIIAAVIFMVEVKVVKPMWRTKRSCFFVAFATFVACLVLPLELGILVGIGINLLYILYHAARPKITVERLTSTRGIDYLLLTPDRCLIFPSIAYVKKLVNKYSIRQGVPVVIDCSHIYGADYTAAQAIESLTKDFAARNQPLLFYNIKPSVSTVFQGLAPKDLVMYDNEDELDDLLVSSCCKKKENEITINTRF